MSDLPVELVRDIVESSARHSMDSDAQWVRRSLAIASRAVYAWVAPILFESYDVTPAKLDALNELVSSGGPPGVAYARTFIADDRDHPIWRTAICRTFLARLDCSQLQVVAGADAIFKQLCGMPHFRPRVVHLKRCKMMHLPLPRVTLQSVFSRITHICVENVSSFECDFDMAGYFPEVTHIIVEDFFGNSSAIILQRILAELPKLQRILLGAYPKPKDRVLRVVERLGALGDNRVYHGWHLRRIGWNDRRAPRSTSLASRARESQDICSEGWSLKRVPSIGLHDRRAPRPMSLARLARDGQDIWSEGEPAV